MKIRNVLVACLALLPLSQAQQFVSDPLQTLPSSSSSAADLVAADVDRDGTLDLLVANRSGQNRLWLGDGHGSFRDATNLLPAIQDPSLEIAVADLNGDGWLDIVVANQFAQNRLLLGSSSGWSDATSGRIPVRTFGTQAVVLFDADGDNDVDILFGDQNQVNRLLLNDGKATFTDVSATQMPQTQGNTHALAAVDVDGDRDLDIVVGNDRTGNRLLLNDGKGTFTEAPSSQWPFSGDATYGLAVGDLNGDGWVDVFFANGLGANRIYLNQGKGSFVDATSQLPSPNNNANFGVGLADVDLDGDLDAVLATSFGQNELWLNDGKAMFTDETARLPQSSEATSAVLLVDLDQDGDPELLFGHNTGPVLLPNRLRHTSATNAPQVGKSWNLSFARHAGFAKQIGLAVPVLTLGPRIQAVPLQGLGNLLINPALPFTLPAVQLPSPAGVQSVGLPIPNDPGFAQVQLSLQAIVLGTSAPLDVALTNAISQQILP